MPTDVTLHAIAVWFLVGFFVGSGWALGAFLVARLTAMLA